MSQSIGPAIETLELLEDRVSSLLANVDCKSVSLIEVRFSNSNDSRVIDVFLH